MAYRPQGFFPEKLEGESPIVPGKKQNILEENRTLEKKPTRTEEKNGSLQLSAELTQRSSQIKTS